MHNDWYTFFSHFWWLMFPLMSLFWGLTSMWSHHTRANRILDMIKGYVDQGKEPPPELLKLMQGSTANRRGDRFWRGPDWHGNDRSGRNWVWVPVFLFAALAGGFVVMAMWPGRTTGLIFVALIMGGLCLGNLVTALTAKDSDQDRTLPK